jgi:hypothetical protein
MDARIDLVASARINRFRLAIRHPAFTQNLMTIW